MNKDFESLITNGYIIHTGSRVFYSHVTVDTDYDYFGFFSEDLYDELTRLGFEVQGLFDDCVAEEKRTKRLKLDNLDIFLFFRAEDYNKYEKAHNIANEVMLRDALPDKEEFMKVFTAMTGFESYE